MKIIRAVDRPTRKASSDYFTGTVLQDPIVEDDDRAKAAVVSFQPGARTNWHTHPRGQTLYVVSGVGRAQLLGSPVLVLNAGDTLVIAPGEKHWHGAAPDHAMTHIAIHEAKDGKHIDWMEPVSDADYSKEPGKA